MRRKFNDWMRDGAYTADGTVFDVGNTVASALAGAVYGYRAIPAEWLEALRGKDVIEHLPPFHPVAALMRTAILAVNHAGEGYGSGFG